MRQLKYIFTALAALLLATSCSKDDLLTDYDGNGTDEPGQMQTYTFTVSPDLTMEGDAETRSAGTPEEMPTRCFMQILGDNVSQDVQQGEPIENGSFTFSVNLPNTTYTFLFWADNGTGNTPTDLREVQYTPGTVAFAAKAVNTPEYMTENEVSLKHAVTKLTLRTTVATSAGEGESIKVTTTCATTYNVDNPSASQYSEQTATKTFDTPTDFAANDNIATFYFIPMDETQDVDVEFHLLKQTIQNISLAANTHVTLQGDLSENGDKWTGTPDYYKQVFADAFFKEGKPFGKESIGIYYYWASDEDNRRIINSILKTTAFGGEYKTVTAPWGEEVFISYLPTSLEIEYNGTSLYIYSQPEMAGSYPDITLPDKIH